MCSPSTCNEIGFHIPWLAELMLFLSPFSLGKSGEMANLVRIFRSNTILMYCYLKLSDGNLSFWTQPLKWDELRRTQMPSNCFGKWYWFAIMFTTKQQACSGLSESTYFFHILESKAANIVCNGPKPGEWSWKFSVQGNFWYQVLGFLQFKWYRGEELQELWRFDLISIQWAAKELQFPKNMWGFCKWGLPPKIIHWKLVGGLEHVLFSHILGIIVPIYFHIFQRGSNHQPEKYWIFPWKKSPPSDKGVPPWLCLGRSKIRRSI